MIDIDKKIMEAMKARDKVTSETYKLLKAKILEFKTAKNAKEYDDDAEVTLIKKMIDDMRKSASKYSEHNRQDLADHELAQVDVLLNLLPPIPTKEDVEKYIKERYPYGVEKKDMGRVIKEVKATLIGVDGSVVAGCVKNILH